MLEAEALDLLHIYMLYTYMHVMRIVMHIYMLYTYMHVNCS